MSMSYADFVIAIAGHKSVAKLLQNIQTPTITSVLIASLKLVSPGQVYLLRTLIQQ